MKHRLIALALPLCLCLSLFLTACGGGEGDQADPAPPAGATLLETASGLGESEILLTVDGREIPAWKYLYWLAYTCDRLAQRYAEAKLPLDWSAPAGGGTLADYAKDQALADVTLYAVVDNWAEAYGALPQDSGGGKTGDAGGSGETGSAGGSGAPGDLNSAEGSGNPSGTEGSGAPDDPALPSLGLSQEQLDQLEDTGRRYAALWTLCQSGESALSPEAGELEAFAREAGALTLDRILIPLGEDRAAAQAKASELFARLNGAEDPAAVFTELAAAGADPAGPRTLLPGEGSLDAALLSAAQALEEGQCSGILESPEGFSILRRLPLDPQPLLSAWFDNALERAAQGAETRLSEACSALDAAAFYGALRQARQEELRASPGSL